MKGMCTICGKWVCLSKFNLNFENTAIILQFSELDIFPLHNNSTYKVVVRMYFKCSWLNFVTKWKCLLYISSTVLIFFLITYS